MYVYRQRLGHLVDSGTDFCADVYAAGVPSGVCADLIPRRRFVSYPTRPRFTVRSPVFGLPPAL
ncbi:hypothetical protein D3C72_2488570 [compost metagenome]